MGTTTQTKGMEDSKIIFVGNLALETKAQQLDDLFSKHGKIQNLDLAGGAAFIEFSTPKEAKNAEKQLDGYEVDGSKIIIKRTDHTRCAICDSTSHWTKSCSESHSKRSSGSKKDACSKCGSSSHSARSCRAFGASPHGSERVDKVCLHYTTTGVCAFGYKCKFYHPKMPGNDGNRYHPHREEQECSFFAKTGYCSFGENCIFRHSLPGSKEEVIPLPPPPRRRDFSPPPVPPSYSRSRPYSPPPAVYRSMPYRDFPPMIPAMYYDRPSKYGRDLRDAPPPPFFDYPLPPYYPIPPPPYSGSRHSGRPSPYEKPSKESRSSRIDDRGRESSYRERDRDRDRERESERDSKGRPVGYYR